MQPAQSKVNYINLLTYPNHFHLFISILPFSASQFHSPDCILSYMSRPHVYVLTRTGAADLVHHHLQHHFHSPISILKIPSSHLYNHFYPPLSMDPSPDPPRVTPSYLRNSCPPCRLKRLHIIERRNTFKQLVAYHTKRVHVNFRVVLLVSKNFGGHISITPRFTRQFVRFLLHLPSTGACSRQDILPRRERARPFQGLGQPKVCDFDDAGLMDEATVPWCGGLLVATQHQIGGLQVSMDNLLRATCVKVRLEGTWGED